MRLVTRAILTLAASCLMAQAACVVDDVVGQRDAAPDSDTEGCATDSFDAPLTADAFPPVGAEPTTTTGYVCPVGDADWYALDVPAGCRGVRITLELAGPFTPVDPSFSVYACDEACLRDPAGGGVPRCCDEEASIEPDPGSAAIEVGDNLCLDPGGHFVVVRDLGDDEEDPRDPRGRYFLAAQCLPETDGGADCGPPGG